MSFSGKKKITLKGNVAFLLPSILDVQPQDTQAHTVSLCEYANMFTLRSG